MSWVKMDDRWPFSRKLRYVEPLDRLMWAMAIPYCSSQNTDGVLDGPMLETVAFLAGVTKPYEAAERLVKAHLFELDATAVGGAWRVHDFLEFNPSAERSAETRAARAEAGRKGGRRSGESRRSKGEANGEANASARLQANRTPSRPVPSRDDSLRSSSADDDDGRVAATIRLIAEHKARTEANVRNPKRYREAVIANADQDGTWEYVAQLAELHPPRDPEWLKDEYLGRGHPTDWCSKCGKAGHIADYGCWHEHEMEDA